MRDARVVTGNYIVPGLTNLHDHSSYDVLPFREPQSTDKQPSVGRPTVHEPCDNRYQWKAAPSLQL